MKKTRIFLLLFFAVIFMNTCKDNATDNPLPDDYKIYYTIVNYKDSRLDIYKIDPEGTNNVLYDSNSAAYSKPQKSNLAMITQNDSTGEFHLIVSNLDGTNKKNIFTTTDGLNHPSISPLGDKILFNERRAYVSFSSNFYLHICNIDGTNDIIIDSTELNTSNWGFEAEFSPDGKSIAYIDFSKDKYNFIYLVDIDGKNKRRINANPIQFKTYFGLNTFDWSSNGKEIALIFEDKILNENILSVLNISDGALTEILRTPNYISKPVWSPDGKKIAYYKEPCNLWTIDISTIKEIQCTDLPGNKNEIVFLLPQWSPDGKYILFEYTKNDENNYMSYGNLSILEIETGKVTILINQEIVKTAFFGW